MRLEGHVSTPTAILIGSALIAAALYLGLTHRPPAPGPTPAPPGAPAHAAPSAEAPDTAPAPVAAAPRGAPAASAAAPAATATREEVVVHVTRALDGQRAAIAARCWAPAVRKQPEPPRARWALNYTFDAEGHQITRGVVEDRETSRPDVTACLSAELPPLRIPAPGHNVVVEVPFALP